MSSLGAPGWSRSSASKASGAPRCRELQHCRSETEYLDPHRLDAVQHFSQRFTNEWIAMLEKDFGKDSLFLVGLVEAVAVSPMSAIT